MPLHPGRKNSTQDRIRWRNLLDKAAQQLAGFELGAQDVEKFLQPARALNVDELARNNGPAMALRVSPTECEVVTPGFEVTELVVASPLPYLTPLLALLQQGHCFILTLSQKRVGLWRSDAQETVPVALTGVPHSLAEALADVEFEKVSNVRPLPRSVGGGGRQAIAYGQGSAAEAVKDEMTLFFRHVDAGVSHALKDEHAPLVVARVTQRVITLRDGKIVSDVALRNEIESDLYDLKVSALGQAILKKIAADAAHNGTPPFDEKELNARFTEVFQMMVN